ncbi:hypothetical protein WV31_10015 [Magnetospirillum sp. ME-1]|uniref:hypothetical protein n=1 Tax=Magnetospirillum sp. ME-1 TaxID=1639348 RepID=UPI000A17A568|nr:hypothetical protein [Magnetospirillum sp. ME-1]ARJ65963.1 hypothetical protein WV31_10015 [Magnetospirillum sp. ME-1]
MGTPKRPARVREYGRSWSPRLPRRDIAFLVRREHCGTADDAIREMIRTRCEASGIPARLIPSCLDYGLLVHRAQQAVWRLCS